MTVRFLALAAIITMVLPAHATTYSVDASQNTIIIPVNGLGTVQGWSSTGGTETQMFNFPIGPYQPGDIIDFGSLTLGAGPINSDQYGEVNPQTFYGTNCYQNPNCFSIILNEYNSVGTVTIPEIYTVGTNGLTVQFAWAFGTYTPPIQPDFALADPIQTPIPATWWLYMSGLILMLFPWLKSRPREDREHISERKAFFDALYAPENFTARPSNSPNSYESCSGPRRL
jgi:hypothetical protein